MNILFVSSEVPTGPYSATGGIGTYIYNLSTQLVKKNHAVTILTKKEYKKHKIRNVKIYRVNNSLLHIRFRKHLIVSKFISFIEYPLLFSLLVPFKINEIIRRENIDIIECNDFGGELWFYLLNPLIKKPVPVVVRLHTPYFVINKYNNSSRNIASSLIGFFEKKVIQYSNHIYSPTKSLSQLIKNYTGRDTDKIIPYPFNIKKYNPVKRKKKNSILYVGKLQYKKGVFDLINTIYELKKSKKDINCTFIGPDTVADNKKISRLMKKRIKYLNLVNNITIINHSISKKELNKYYRNTFVLVVPSIWENFPNVVLEAFQFGIPVVASNVGGISEMITDGYNGLLYKPGKKAEPTKSILKVIENEKFAKIISQNAFKTLTKKYSAEKISSETAEFYQQATEK